MGYPRELLNDDEQIVLERHPHWSYMFGPISMLFCSLIVFVVILAIGARFYWIGLIIIALALLAGVGRYLRWQTTEFVLTSSRIIVRTGILSKAGLEIPLGRVMNISYHQAVWERILGTGDLIVESAGEDGHQLFTDVAKPALVQNLIYKLHERDDNGSPSDGLGMGGKLKQQLSVPEQLEKLAHLRDTGVLSDEEFQRTKQQILDGQ